MLNGLVFVGASIILLRLNWQLGLLVMLPVPLILWLAQRTNRRARRAHRQVQDKLADISGKLQDNIAGIRVIQSFTTEDHERERFSQESVAHDADGDDDDQDLGPDQPGGGSRRPAPARWR